MNLILLNSTCWAEINAPKKPQTKAPPPPAKIKVYEEDTEGDIFSFVDVVSTVRRSEDSVEVLFKKRQGAHQAPSDKKMLADLLESQNTKSEVSVRIDSQDRIISVSRKASAVSKEKPLTPEEKKAQEFLKRISPD